MRDFKSIFLVFLFISNYSAINASELQHVCRIIPPGLEFVSNCNPYGGITYYGGPECEREILMKIYLSNLTGYNNYPMSSGPYFAPSSLPDLYVFLDADFDNIYETQIGPINGFMWNGLEQNGMDGGMHYIFEHDINLADYLFINNPCPSPSDSYEIKTKIMEKKNGSYSLFNVQEFSGFDDVVSCEVFYEACMFCQDGNGDPINSECTSSLPIYNTPICFDCTTPCRKTLHFGNTTDDKLISVLEKEASNIALEKESNTISKVTPNPFKDEVVVEFDIHDKSPTQIEIFDLSGAIVFNKTISSGIGNRKESINLERLPKGIYFVKIIGRNSSTATKIVKQ